MRGPGKKITKKQIIEALRQTQGIMKEACRILDMSASLFWRKYRHDPEIEAVIKELHLIGATNVIDTIYSQAINGDINSQKMYLKYCPEVKDLGWKEETTVNLKEDVKLTEEEKQKLKEEMFGKL